MRQIQIFGLERKLLSKIIMFLLVEITP